MNGSLYDRFGYMYMTNNGNEGKHPTKAGILKVNGSDPPKILCEGQKGFWLGHNQKGEMMYGTEDNGLWVLPDIHTHSYSEKINSETYGVKQSDWTIRIGPEQGLRLQNVLCAYHDEKGRYWMGRGSQGLAVCIPEKDAVYNWINDDDPDNYGVHSMDMDYKGNLWLGTNKGLCFLEVSDKISPDMPMKSLLQKVALEYTGSSLVEVCKVYKKNTLVFGNSRGYFLLDLKRWYQQADNKRLYILPISEKYGHQGGMVNQNGVWIDNDDIWLACENGAVRYTPGIVVHDTIVPKVVIDTMKAGRLTFNNFEKKIIH